MQKKIIELPPNRVRRNYQGGLLLESWQGAIEPKDGDKPEDWIASTTKAKNPGLDEVPLEGLSRVSADETGQLLTHLLKVEGKYYLGKNHLDSVGEDMGFLAKLLDSSMRLHVQAHPTAEWASKNLQSRWGKLETYVILGIREGYEGYLWMGFQKAPSKEEWNRIVMEQDTKAMHACFKKIPVKAGQVWRIPGGMPHAIGEGLFVLEVMEPTDWVVRCEFEREGIVVPEEARFMGIEPEKAMEIFDLREESIEEVQERCMVKPILEKGAKNYRLELLIGPDQTECFKIRRLSMKGSVEIHKAALVLTGIVTKGKGMLWAEEDSLEIEPGTSFLIPAGIHAMGYECSSEEALNILWVTPGYGLEEGNIY